MSLLVQELMRAGLMTGPIDIATSHSDMERTRKALLGVAQFHGNETFLKFGNDLHANVLVNTPSKDKTLLRMARMVKYHPTFKEFMDKAICELKVKGVLSGVPINFILDIHQPHKKRGADLKTTSSSSDRQFLKSAIEYGYFRQGVTYMRCAKLDNFVFIGVQKTEPHKIYILNVMDYKEELRYANEELDLLLYIFKHYGKISK